jgi:polyhydroxybutyrate depolymerase
MHGRMWSGALIALALGCTSDGDQPGPDVAGSQTGGTAGNEAQAGGGAGDVTGSGGSRATGGDGGAAGSSAGSGGASLGGSAGKGGASGGAGGGAAGGAQGDAGGAQPTPSAGCGKGGRPAGGVVTVADQYVLTFPATYDGKVPMPVVFGFHGANRTNIDFRSNDAATQGGDFEKSYVMAYVKSVGNDWTSQLAPNFARFDAVYNELANNNCVDTARVFAMGHSSGAQFISNLVCRPEPRLRGVAPVASSPYGGNCRAIPVLIIHGKMDNQRGNDGAAYVAQYVMRNGCSSTTAPYPVATCNSIAGGSLVTPGCVEYQMCGKNPTIWCSHNDPNYSGTNHGWPCFANKAIIDFFNGLR